MHINTTKLFFYILLVRLGRTYNSSIKLCDFYVAQVLHAATSEGNVIEIRRAIAKGADTNDRSDTTRMAITRARNPNT